MQMIYAHENVRGIVGMFLKGPPHDKGFAWCSREGGAGHYWSIEESAGLRFVGDLVLHKGWDSSGYEMMMRSLQNIIRVIENMRELKCEL